MTILQREEKRKGRGEQRKESVEERKDVKMEEEDERESWERTWGAYCREQKPLDCISRELKYAGRNRKLNKEIEPNCFSPRPAFVPTDKRALGKRNVWALVVTRTIKKEVTETVPLHGLAAPVSKALWRSFSLAWMLLLLLPVTWELWGEEGASPQSVAWRQSYFRFSFILLNIPSLCKWHYRVWGLEVNWT